MRPLLLALAVPLLLTGCAVVPATRDAPAAPVIRTVETLTPELMAELHVPGVSIAGISRCRVAWHREFGLRVAGKPGRVRPDTVFEACSIPSGARGSSS